MKKKLASLMLAFALAIGGATVGSVVTAEPAEAATAYNCRILDAGYGYTLGTSGYRYATYCYIDYTWSEEVFFGFRDGWKITRYHTERCDYIYNVC